MAMFEEAMRMFNPFRANQTNGPASANGPTSANGQEPPKSDGAAGTGNDTAIDELKRKLDELQNQLAELSKKS
jgi:polyhydroxyalkanoate synthesis regulator protein